MLVIRLTRIGKKNQPSYRVVLTEKKNPVRGKFQEILGSYNPRLKTKQLKAERIKYWLSKGAQPSDTIHNLLVSEKILDAKKVKAWTPKKKSVEARKAKEIKEMEDAKAREEASVPKEASASAEAPVTTEPADKPAAEEAKEEAKEEKAEGSEEKKTEEAA